jgi:Xaa-Pro aminopeptidase
MMTEKDFIEDTSVEGRRAEVQEKVARIRKGLEESGKEALFLIKHPNFSWITAGSKGFIAVCFDNSAIGILITKTKMFAICNVIEANRVQEEDKLEELGFEMYVYRWQENKMESFIKDQVSSWDKVISDVPMAGAVVDNKFILSVRLPFTNNEIARYLYLGEYLSRGLEEYLPTVKPGMTEYEIAGGIANALWKYNVEQVMFLVSVDERADKYRHALPTEKKLKSNLLVSINGRYKGLITTTSRQVNFGKPRPGLVEQYNDCCDMETDVISKAAPGVDELELYETLRQSYITKGHPTMFDKHGQGGSQGYFPREYMITPDSHHIIKKDTAYCFNPVIDGTKSEDAFIVRENGVFMITRPVLFPKRSYTFGNQTIERPVLLVVD